MNVIGKLFGFIFGLFFAGAGFFVLSQTALPLLLSWHEATDWQPHYAQLFTVGGSDSETTADYKYVVRGVPYENNKVYLTDFNDNIGSYHKDLKNRLRNNLRSKQPLQIWVDPAEPSRSVIDKDLRWGLFTFMTLFCSVFILIGLTVSITSLFRKKKSSNQTNRFSILKLKKEWDLEKKEKTTSFIEFLQQRRQQQLEQQASHPKRAEDDQPWLAKKEWQNNKIRSEAKSGTIAMWLFAIFWNGVSSPIIFILPEELRSGNYPALLALLFPVVGLFLLYKAVSMSREYYKFGIIHCALDPFPGSIGGNVGGTFLLSKGRFTGEEFNVELQCVFTYVSGSGKNRSRKEDIKWAEAGSAKVVQRSGSTELRFRFDVPPGLPESDIDQSGSYHFWRLKLHSELPGVDLQRSYRIPVYTTVEQSQTIRHDLSRQMEEKQEQAAEKSKMALEMGRFDKAGLDGSVKVKKVDRGLILVHPLFRNKVISLFALIFGGSFGGATIAMTMSLSKFSFFSVITILFSLPFAAVGLIGTVLALYLPLNSLKITIAARKLRVVRRWIFLPIYIKEVKSTEVEKCITKESSTAGQGVRRKQYFKIIAHLRNGSKLTIAEGIEGKDLANHFCEYLYRRIKSGY